MGENRMFQELEKAQMKIRMLEKKMEVLEHAIVSTMGAYYSINLTKNIVPGIMYQVIDGKEYNINERIGVPEHAKFSEVIAYWGNQLDEEEKEAYFDFFQISNLLENYKQGNTHVCHKYWTKSAVFERMLAEQHIVMFEDEESGDILGITYVIDLTKRFQEETYKEELERNHKELENALIVAQHANKAKTVFLNNMSHDIRTPMNAIIGFTSLAGSHLDNKEKVKEYLRKISVSSEHLLSLINDVLDMSRIESGKVTIQEKPVHLPELIHDIRTIVQPNITSKQLDFLIDTVDVRNENIITDKLRLTQILLNILSNAVKFNKTGGLISLRIKQVNDAPIGYAKYHFIIKDTGIGMSQEFQSHIFESFARETSSTVSGIPGTGLGMAITKNIVDMMGGDILVKSEEDKGSEFDVILTFKLSGEETNLDKVDHLKGLKVLVADDDTDTCLSISSMLTEIGMRSEWTVSGKEAIIRTRHALEMGDEFYAYIIDWLMPDMNGIETVRRIRRVIGDDRPIIILTAYDWADVEQEAKEAGVTAFCEKPLFISELRSILSRPYNMKEEETKEEEDESFVGKKILLVEDNELNQEIAETILTEAGFLVEIAEDGVVAVDKVKNADFGQYDLILMDIQMPIMDGYEATRQIRAMEKDGISKIPILAMTANAFDEDRQKSMDVGMDGYLSKPIEIEELLRAIKAVLK